jgi:hypothetical protein
MIGFVSYEQLFNQTTIIMDTNWLALVLAAASSLVVGFVYYNPKVLGTAWMKESGITEEKAKDGNMPLIFGLSLIFAFVISMHLNYVVGHGDAEYGTFGHGAFHGALIALFVGIPILCTNALYEQRSWKYMLINAGYWLITLAVMGGILSKMLPAQ